MWARFRTMSLLLACLAASSCGAGDFCDVVTGRVDFAPETSRQIVRTDRTSAERIAVQNEYGATHCGW